MNKEDIKVRLNRLITTPYEEILKLSELERTDWLTLLMYNTIVSFADEMKLPADKLIAIAAALSVMLEIYLASNENKNKLIN